MTLKILLIGHAYPPYHGGLSHVLYNMSKELAKAGHDVTVLTLKLHQSLKNATKINGIKVIRLFGFAPSNNYFVPSPKIVKFLNSMNIDIVHVHNIGALTVPITVLFHNMFKLGSRLIISPHYHESGSTLHTKIAWFFYKPIAKEILQMSNKVHAVSSYESKLIKRDFNVNPIIIPNGVKEDVYKYKWNPSKIPIVTYAGRIEKYKRIHILVKAISRAEKLYGKRIILRIIGNGNYLNKVLTIANSLKVNIEHYDFQPRNKYLELLSKSSIFINISKYEAFSISVAEALAIGIPTIVAKPWGFNFNKHGTIVINGDDIDTIAKTILKILNNDIISRNFIIPTWKEVIKEIVNRLYC